MSKWIKKKSLCLLAWVASLMCRVVCRCAYVCVLRLLKWGFKKHLYPAFLPLYPHFATVWRSIYPLIPLTSTFTPSLSDKRPVLCTEDSWFKYFCTLLADLMHLQAWYLHSCLRVSSTIHSHDLKLNTLSVIQEFPKQKCISFVEECRAATISAQETPE